MSNQVEIDRMSKIINHLKQVQLGQIKGSITKFAASKFLTEFEMKKLYLEKNIQRKQVTPCGWGKEGSTKREFNYD